MDEGGRTGIWGGRRLAMPSRSGIDGGVKLCFQFSTRAGASLFVPIINNELGGNKRSAGGILRTTFLSTRNNKKLTDRMDLEKIEDTDSGLYWRLEGMR